MLPWPIRLPKSTCAVASLGELGRNFRNDVHRATVATVESTKPPRLVLTLDDGSQIQYEGTTSGAARVQAVASGPKRQEAYVLGVYQVLGFQTSNNAAREVRVRLGRAVARSDDEVIHGEFTITAVAPAPIPGDQPREAPTP